MPSLYVELTPENTNTEEAIGAAAFLGTVKPDVQRLFDLLHQTAPLSIRPGGQLTFNVEAACGFKGHIIFQVEIAPDCEMSRKTQELTHSLRESDSQDVFELLEELVKERDG